MGGMRPRLVATSLLALALFAGCTREAVKTPPADEAPIAAPLPPTVTRGRFTIEADKLDTWNAVGQIVVNMPGLEYKGRSQMLDLYDVRYRGEEFLVLTKALLLSDTIKRTTTEVTATTKAGKPIDSDVVADLLAQLEQKLPTAIVDVQKRQAEEAKARKAKASKKSKSKSKKKKK